MRLFTAASLSLAALLAIEGGAFAADVLTPQGLGPVKIGMTRREAEKALGAKLLLDYPDDTDSDECNYASRKDGRDPDRSYMLINGRITRIDIDLPRRGHKLSHVKTELGFGLGSYQSQIVHAYGRRIVVQPHPYLEDQGSYLVIDSDGHQRGIIFETDHGKVTEFRAGTYPSLGYIEECN